MFTINKKDKQSIIDALNQYHAFITGTISEYTSSAVLNGNTRDILQVIENNAKEYTEIRNANNLSVGQLVLSLTRASQGELSISSSSDQTEKSGALLNASLSYYNDMMHILVKFFSTLETEFQRVQNNDLRTKLNKSEWNHDLGELVGNIIDMIESMAEQSKIQLKNSMNLKENATQMLQESEELSNAANQQAASLEETAAAIEELTSNVSANVEKTNEMTRVAQEAKLAAEHGNTIANDSLNAMNEIVNATEAINQAVDVIDNIAFQTNILSLNAAVEAATAGDAGRGFAVVAQEVRNLANRSAEAAKQIHDLARTARLKSQNGLETSQNMMNGFALISTKIEETDSMVKDVASASREQMAGISQINDAVAQLDQMTQQNAKTAENVAQIANGILVKTEQFEQMLSRITFDTATDKQNCDINMSFETASLKMDHVNFKENTYKKLKESPSAWKVTSHHDCNLGKWIDAHANESFAKTGEWNELLIAHEKVHNGTQAFIDADKSNQSLEHIAAQLEEATVGVFKGIDNIKNIHCTNSAQSHQQSHAIAKKLPQNNRQMQPSLKAVSHSTNNKPTLKSNKHITQKSDDVWESF